MTIGVSGGAVGSAELDRGSAASPSSLVTTWSGGAEGMTAAGSTSVTGGTALSLRNVLVKVPQPASMSPTASQMMVDSERRTHDPPRAHDLYLRYRQTIAEAPAR